MVLCTATNATIMPSLPAARAANASYAPSYLPVAVFVGGTSGIGQAMAEAFAKYTVGRAHIIIVGRNRLAAEKIIESFPKPTESDVGWKHEFISCDVNLMKNVREMSDTLLQSVPRINYLILSAGVFGFLGRHETEEGIDVKLASRYYSRFVFIKHLLPALRVAKTAGEDAKVMSILGAGQAAGIDLNDLGLKKKYSGLNAMLHTLAYNDLMLAEFSSQEPGIAFVHTYPGVVNTPIFILHVPSMIAKYLIAPFLSLLFTSPAVCAEYMLFALFDGDKGFFRRTENGDSVGMKNFLDADDAQRILWEHTLEETKESGVETGRETEPEIN